MEPPSRLTVPTCIGCGAMALTGTCETGCREQKLELVRAAACDELAALRAAAESRAETFGPLVARLAVEEVRAGECERAYRASQAQARAALRSCPPVRQEIDLDEPAEPAITWWCPDCGGLDAPQPCLAICVWRGTEWVAVELYERERAKAIAAARAEDRLRDVLRRNASITPRPEHWHEGWVALQRDARRALAVV